MPAVIKAILDGEVRRITVPDAPVTVLTAEECVGRLFSFGVGERAALSLAETREPLTKQHLASSQEETIRLRLHVERVSEPAVDYLSDLNVSSDNEDAAKAPAHDVVVEVDLVASEKFPAQPPQNDRVMPTAEDDATTTAPVSTMAAPVAASATTVTATAPPPAAAAAAASSSSSVLRRIPPAPQPLSRTEQEIILVQQAIQRTFRRLSNSDFGRMMDRTGKVVKETVRRSIESVKKDLRKLPDATEIAANVMQALRHAGTYTENQLRSIGQRLLAIVEGVMTRIRMRAIRQREPPMPAVSAADAGLTSTHEESVTEMDVFDETPLSDTDMREIETSVVEMIVEQEKSQGLQGQTDAQETLAVAQSATTTTTSSSSSSSSPSTATGARMPNTNPFLPPSAFGNEDDVEDEFVVVAYPTSVCGSVASSRVDSQPGIFPTLVDLPCTPEESVTSAGDFPSLVDSPCSQEEDTAPATRAPPTASPLRLVLDRTASLAQLRASLAVDFDDDLLRDILEHTAGDVDSAAAILISMQS